MVTLETIREKIRRMGQDYRPGNASKPGHLYNPLPFPEFSDIPHQRDAVGERFNLMETMLPRPFKRGRLLDLGCHTGYNCFRFTERGFKCTGVELDPLTAEIARDVNELKQTGIEFINAAASIDLVRQLGHFDVILFLSTFQWVVYAEGFEAATALLAEVQKHCDVLFFETSMGQEGKMKLPQLPDAKAVQALLKKSGVHANVDCLGVIPSPGSPSAQPRLLFRSQNRPQKGVPDLWALPPKGIQQLLNYAQTNKPVYAKENAHFVSRVHPAQLDGGTRVAVKIVQAKSDMARLLLYREHEFLASLRSPRFPGLTAFGLDEARYVLITPWIEGPTLAQAAAAGAIPGDRAQLRAQVQEAADALAAAGIRHRDLRATNVILSPQGPVVIDFGWACWADEADCPAPPELEQPDDGRALAALLAALS